MDSIGVEVGQKMRSAIKAKLMELGCYVDDELPDYIMVMVANKRSKSQMNEDLKLFLTTKTEAFVEWLQVVLRKLKEITVTNPDIYKRVSKHKVDDSPKGAKVKKEKKEKGKGNKKSKKKDVKPIIKDISQSKSLTDDLPVEASKLSEVRKIVVMQENQNSNSNTSNVENVIEDSFDIPPLSAVAMSNESELAEIEEKIKSVKSRLGIQVRSDSDDEDFINIKAEPEELFAHDSLVDKSKSKEEDKLRKIKVVRSLNSAAALQEWTENLNKNSDQQVSKNKGEHPRIVFAGSPVANKISALERLGKRPGDPVDVGHRNKISLIDARKEEKQLLGLSKTKEKHSKTDFEQKQNAKSESRQSALKRLGVLSKVAVPQKLPSESEEEVVKDVPSAVKVKPRTLPPINNQANKNLLLKAVAEAQRSIAQTPVVGSNAKPDALYTKRYREKLSYNKNSGRKLSDREKEKIKSILNQAGKREKKELDFSSDDDNLEYVPKPVKKSRGEDRLEYIPSTKDSDHSSNTEPDQLGDDRPRPSKGHTFIITLDGITRKEPNKNDENHKTEKRRSPIVFDGVTSASHTNKTKQIPDKLPIVYPPLSIKTKERCKYWPNCRQGSKCEFVHPTTSCKAFPQCKFGDKCLYIHPTCKFETSCTRKDCPYSHLPNRSYSSIFSTPQLCKYYPNCSNIHCLFYHPKPCKYGKFCKNQAECGFSHGFPTKSNLTWRSALKS